MMLFLTQIIKQRRIYGDDFILMGNVGVNICRKRHPIAEKQRYAICPKGFYSFTLCSIAPLINKNSS